MISKVTAALLLLASNAVNVSADVETNQNVFEYQGTTCSDGLSVDVTLSCYGGSSSGSCELGAGAYVSGTICGSFGSSSDLSVSTWVSGYEMDNYQVSGVDLCSIGSCSNGCATLSSYQISFPSAPSEVWPDWSATMQVIVTDNDGTGYDYTCTAELKGLYSWNIDYSTVGAAALVMMAVGGAAYRARKRRTATIPGDTLHGDSKSDGAYVEMANHDGSSQVIV